MIVVSSFEITESEDVPNHGVQPKDISIKRGNTIILESTPDSSLHI